MSKLSSPLPDVLTLVDAVSMWERSLRAADKSPRTVGSYAYALAKLTKSVGNRPIGAVTRADHEALMSDLQAQGLGAATRVAVQRPVRTFWKWAIAHPDVPVEKDPMAGMELPRVPEKVVEFVSDEQLRRILATCQAKSRHAYRAHRDEAILRVLAGSGARLSGITNLRLEDVDLPAMAALGAVEPASHALRIFWVVTSMRWNPCAGWKNAIIRPQTDSRGVPSRLAGRRSSPVVDLPR